MTEPLSNKPKITQKNILEGFVPRYFIQSISTKRITEVDKKQYDILKKNPYYKSIELKWVIAGNENSTVSADGTIIYGVRHQNQVTIEWYNKQFPGLVRILSNPLEYFVGKINNINNSLPTPVVALSKFSSSHAYSVITLTSSPTQINFIVTQSASVPTTQYISITELNNRSVTGLTLQTQSSWLTSTLNTPITPTTVSASVNTTLLPTGSYTSSIQVSSIDNVLSQDLIINVSMAVYKEMYVNIFTDTLLTGVDINLNQHTNTLGSYSYSGTANSWLLRSWDLAQINEQNSDNVARLTSPLHITNGTKVTAFYYRYGAPVTIDGGLALFVPTGTSNRDYIRAVWSSFGTQFYINYVSASGDVTVLASQSGSFGLSSGIDITLERIDDKLYMYSGSVFLMSASIPPHLITDASNRTIGFYSYGITSGVITFGNLRVDQKQYVV